MSPRGLHTTSIAVLALAATLVLTGCAGDTPVPDTTSTPTVTSTTAVYTERNEEFDSWFREEPRSESLHWIVLPAGPGRTGTTLQAVFRMSDETMVWLLETAGGANRQGALPKVDAALQFALENAGSFVEANLIAYLFTPEGQATEVYLEPGGHHVIVISHKP